MERIAGVNLPVNKRALVSLTYIHGIGPKYAMDILKANSLDPTKRIKDFSEDDDLYFFGDNIEKGGNDHTLAMAIVNNMMGTAYNVEDWRETRTILEGFPHD